MNNDNDFRCAKCDSRQCFSGRKSSYVGVLINWLRSVPIHVRVCLGCGTIDEFVPQKELARLRG